MLIVLIALVNDKLDKVITNNSLISIQIDDLIILTVFSTFDVINSSGAPMTGSTMYFEAIS